jgi:RNA recognition motif-containing protein
MILYAGNLSTNATEQDFRHLFANYGQVNQMSLVKGDIGESNFFAFIGINDDDHALRAIHDINGTKLSGRILIVNKARPRKSGPPSPSAREAARSATRGRKFLPGRLAGHATSTIRAQSGSTAHLNKTGLGLVSYFLVLLVSALVSKGSNSQL